MAQGPGAHTLILPVNLAQQLEHLVLRALHEHIVEEMLDEGVHGRELDDFAGDALRRVALVEGILKHNVEPLVQMARALLAPHQLDLIWLA